MPRIPDGEHEAANERTDRRSNLIGGAAPHGGVGEIFGRHEAGDDRCGGRPANCPRDAGPKEEEIDPADVRVRERSPSEA